MRTTRPDRVRSSAIAPAGAFGAPALARTSAQAGQNPPPQGGGPLPGLDNGDMTPGEIQRLFDAYLVMEAQQALQLSDQQYPQFLTRLRRCRTRGGAISRSATS